MNKIPFLGVSRVNQEMLRALLLSAYEFFVDLLKIKGKLDCNGNETAFKQYYFFIYSLANNEHRDTVLII